MSRRLIDGQLPVRPDNIENDGRPSKLNDELIKQICNAIMLGAYPSVAAAFCRISPSTLSNWVRAGQKDPNSKCGELLAAMQHSLAIAQIRDQQALEHFVSGRPAEYAKDSSGKIQLDGAGNPIKIREEIKPDKSAIMFKLDRRWAKTWGSVLRVDAISDAIEETDLNIAGENVNGEKDVTPEAKKEIQSNEEYVAHMVKQFAKMGVGE